MKTLERILKLLASPILAITLLIIFAAYIALGTKNSLSLYSSIIFLLIMAVLFLNITLCTLRQIKRNRKNWGSVIFHLGLVLVISGGFVTYAFGFQGKFGLAERQAFTGNFNGYTVKGPLAQDYNGNLKVFLNKISPLYKKNETFSRTQITLLVNDLNEKEYQVSMGNPVRVSFYSLTNDTFGYYINLKAKVDGQEESVCVGLDTLTKTNSESYTGTLPINGGNYNLHLQFYPDYQSYLKQPGQPGVNPVNPVLSAALFDKDNKFITEKKIPAGANIAMQGNVEIGFDSYYNWASFILKRDYGYPLFYVGFIVSIIGLVLIYWKIPFQAFKTSKGD